MREVYQEQKKAAGKKVLSLEEIKEAFLALPNEKDRIYELKVIGFARDWADFIIKRINKDGPEPPILQLLPFDSLFLGLAVALLIMAIGLLRGRLACRKIA